MSEQSLLSGAAGRCHPPFLLPWSNGRRAYRPEADRTASARRCDRERSRPLRAYCGEARSLGSIGTKERREYRSVCLGGANRYDTAALVSQAAFPTDANIVYVTTGESFPDTMASVPAAASTNGPVLLVRSDSIPTATSNEIKRLNPTQIIIVGGPVPISASLDSQLASLTDATVQRRFGPDR